MASRALVLVLALICCTGASAQQATKIKTIQAVIKTEPWRGWGGGEELPEGRKAEQKPEQFTVVPAAAEGEATFSGKVIGLPPEQKAEIGIVSLKGVHWINNDNYEWFGLPETREFSITSKKNLDQRKTLAVKGGNGQWTFLRAQFEPGEGAKDIELRVKPAKKVAITMEDDLGNPISSFRGEIFNAYVITDDKGRPMRPQRFGNPTSANGAMVLQLPDEPFAVLLAAERVAPYYEIIDPREATQFHFKMIEAGRIKGIVTRDGNPAANERVFLVNNAAPLSASQRRTDTRGRFDLPGRVPGIQHIVVGDYETDVELKPGETADLKIDLTGPAPAAR